MHEWFGDPFFGMMVASALLIILALIISGYREKLEKRRYLQYLERKRREIKEQQGSAVSAANQIAPHQTS
jgi:hypothetical protein